MSDEPKKQRRRYRPAFRNRKPKDDQPKTDSPKIETQDSDFDTAFTKVMNCLLLVVSFPVRVLHYVLNPPGSAFLFAIAALYFLAVNVEGYFQSLPGNAAIAFLPKPFIEDNANLVMFLRVVIDLAFWLAASVSTIVQAIQTWSLREASIKQQKRQYETVKDYKVIKPEKEQIDLAKYRAKKFKGAGMKNIQKLGAIVIMAYAIDLAIAYYNFPLFGLGDPAKFAINFFWIILSTFGTELFLTLFLLSLEDVKRVQVPKPEKATSQAS